jgi:hypothetical protein
LCAIPFHIKTFFPPGLFFLADFLNFRLQLKIMFSFFQDNSTMLIEAAKGGHTPVVGLLLDYPRSIVMATPPAATSLSHQHQQQHQVGLEQQHQDLVPAQLGASPATIKTAANSLKLRKTQRPSVVGGNVKPLAMDGAAGKVSGNVKAGLVARGSPVVNESTGYDFIEGSGFVIEGKHVDNC